MVPVYLLEDPPDDEPTVDGGEFLIEIDDSLLDEAVAAVDKRMTAKLQSDLGIDGPLNLDELLAVEDELDLEIDDDEFFEDNDDDDFSLDDALGGGVTQVAEVRIRAMEAESERDELKNRMSSLSTAKREVEAKLDRLNERASRAQATTKNANEARAAAETRAKRLKSALEAQQSDIEKLIERRKKDTQTQYAKGRTDAVLTLIEVLDSLELALGHKDLNPEQIVAGIQLAVKQFDASLRRIGVEAVPAESGGPFDPNIHEAITRVKSGDIDSGNIVEVITRGFRLDGRLIRAARVSVATD
jgi:molecular chaperone GrpE